MLGNTFGRAFACTTFGESHGGGVGVVIDGCPAGIKIDLAKVQTALARRRPGQSEFTSPRDEADLVECLSGLDRGVSLGTPIALLVRNKDIKPEHYADLTQTYRPSHADYTYEAKYGVRAASGGGRASARETIGRVAAGAIAEQVMATLCPTIEVVAWVDRVKDIAATSVDMTSVTRALVDADPLRCPDAKARKAMAELIRKTRDAGDSVGGVIAGVVRGCPPGIGEPVFDKLEAELARAMMSLPASKGFEVGLGFAATELFGSEHNDAFTIRKGRVRTVTNRSGGIQGGISNGEDIWFRVAFKPVATIFKAQDSVAKISATKSARGKSAAPSLKRVKMQPAKGRHDPCVLPRAVPMVEAMALLTICEHLLRNAIYRR